MQDAFFYIEFVVYSYLYAINKIITGDKMKFLFSHRNFPG